MSGINAKREIETPSGAIKRHSPLIAAEALFLLSTVSALFRGDATSAVIPAALLLASFPVPVVERWARMQIPQCLQLLYALLLLGGPYLGSHWGFYAVWTPWDTVVHFYSGFVVALGIVFAMGITGRRYGLSMPPWLAAVLIVAVSGFVALLWEIAEFASDALIGTTAQITNFDTMTDLIAGTASAGIVAAALVLFLRRGWFTSLSLLLVDLPHQCEPDVDMPAVRPSRTASMAQGS